MEFILDNKKYSILNHELFINYLMVDNYFRNHYSKYDYDIRFDFVEPLLEKEKIEFEDILEGTKDLETLIEKEEINFVPIGLKIYQHTNGNFKIIYQDLDFNNIRIGEAIPFLITLNSLLTHKPIITLVQIEEELENFIEKFRQYNK
ncbi:hypothetical protein [uncultured Methanobrevibacter sp.]|uniref:hypothetical protein n=1 Tax=uncultured Methanobrevibacter sp. TaxID=253161 RepID=UPI0025EC9C02|nr:hypothetical protein [uncultured Methanobrevibacter sp.]MCI6995189.1 hypothetical protein [Methanobrevibacter sp.]